MSEQYSEYVVLVNAGQPETLPPKDGSIVAAYIIPCRKVSFIYWHHQRGSAMSSWFDTENHAIAENNIHRWEKTVPESPHYEEVLRLNAHQEMGRTS